METTCRQSGMELRRIEQVPCQMPGTGEKSQAAIGCMRASASSSKAGSPEASFFESDKV